MNAAAMPIEVFNAIVDHLQKQPYQDVYKLIDALREQTKTVELEEETPSNDEE